MEFKKQPCNSRFGGSNALFFQIAISLGILPYIWADVPLVSYLGIVTLRISNRYDEAETGQGVLVHIAPSTIEEVVSWCICYDQLSVQNS